MKLRLPLALQAILLACMVNSSASYATTTPPAEQAEGAQDQEGGNVTVQWRPAPVEEEETGQNEDADEGVLDEGDKQDNEGVAQQSQSLAEGKPVGGNNSRFGRIVGGLHHGTSRQGSGGAGGMAVTSYTDALGRIVLQFHTGKGEALEISPDTVDTYAFWNIPEGYMGSYFPYLFTHEQFRAVWVGSNHVNVPYTVRIPATVPATKAGQSSGTTGTSTSHGGAPSYGGGFSAPAAGGGGGGGGGAVPARRKPAAAAPTPTLPAEEEDAEKQEETDLTTDDTGLAENGTTAEDGAAVPETSTQEAAAVSSDTTTPPPPMPTAGAASTLRPAVAAVQAAAPAAISLAVPAPVATSPAVEAASTPAPALSGAMVAGMFSQTPQNANTTTWKGGGGNQSLTDSNNWNGTFSGGNRVFIFDGSTMGENKTLTGSNEFNLELVAGNKEEGNVSSGFIVRNGAHVTMTDNKWFCMLQVEADSSLDFTLSAGSIKRNNNNTPGNANVYAAGSLTIRNLSMCLGSDWHSNDQNWLITSTGTLTLDGDITYVASNAPYIPWHIQKQAGGDALATIGTEVDILAITGSGSAYTQLQAINEKKLLDIQVYSSDGQLMDGKMNLTSTGISVYVSQDLVWKGADGAQWTADGSFYKAPDNTQADAPFQQWDKVTFNTAGANVAITGTVTPYKVNVQAATTFTGGTIEADEVNLSSSMTLTDTTLTTPAINVSGTAAISGNALAFTSAGTVLNMGGDLTVTGALGVAAINVTADSSIAGSVNATNMNLGGGYTLTVNSGVTPVNIKVAANQSGTLSAESSTDITSNVSVAAGANLIVGGQAHLKTRNANGSLSMDSTGKITLLGGDASFYNGKEKYTVEARTDLSEGLSSTIQGSGEVSLYSDNTTISNAAVTFNSYRYVNGTLTNCDVTTADNDENRFLSVQNNIHNLTVHGNTVVQRNMTINGALVVESGKSLSVNKNSAKLTINGTATINGSPAASGTGLGATNGQTIAIGSTGSVVVHSGMNVFGTLEIDMTGRVAGGSSAIIDASDGSFSLGSTGTIDLINYGALSNGRYNLIKTNAATADTIVGKFENYFTNTPTQVYAVSQTNGLVQLVISAANVEAVTLTENTSWVHDISYATDKPVTVAAGVTLTMTKGASIFDAHSRSSLGDINLGEGSTFKIGTGMNIEGRTVLATDKPVIESHISLGQGSQVVTEDGGWYFQGGLTVQGDATVINNWGKGWAYGVIDGAAGHTLTFAPVNDDGYNLQQVISFKEDGDFAGTVELKKSSGSSTGGVRYVIDAANAFQNAEVKLTDSPELAFDVAAANIRKLSGTGVLMANAGQYSGNYTGVTTLNVAETSTFTGTVGAKISLVMGENAALTLTGSTVEANGSVTGSNITLDNTSVAGTINVTAGGSASLVNGSAVTGTISMDLTGATAGGTAIVSAAGGSVSHFTATGVADLGLGTYNLITAADADAAKALAGGFTRVDSSGMHRFDATTDGATVQLAVSYGANTDTSWYYDVNLDTATPVLISDGATLTVTKPAGTPNLAAGTAVSLGDITLRDADTTLLFNATNLQVQTVLTTDKVTVASHITLGAGTKLQTDDGSWYFQEGLTVTGDATVTHKWGKGLVYGAISGSGTPENERGTTLTFAPDNSDNQKQVIAFHAAGDFGGTVALKAPTHSGSNQSPTYYVVDHGNAFQNAEVKLNNANLAFDVESANFRKLSGSGTLSANNAAHSGDYEGVSTLHLAEDSSFSGTLNGVIVDAGAHALTLGTLTIVNGGALTATNVTNTGALTLDYANLNDASTSAFLTATGTHDITGLTGLTIANYSGLAEGTYNLVSTDATTAAALIDLTGAPSNTTYKSFSVANNGGLLQLTVTNLVDYHYTTSDTLTRNQQIPADIRVVVGGEGTTVTLKTGDNTGDDAPGEVFTFGDITVESGSTLKIHLGHEIHRTVDKDDKMIFGSSITLEDGAKLLTEDGSYYFSKEIVVKGNATIQNQWDKGLVYEAINGVDAATDATHRVTFTPTTGANPQLITFAGEGTFGGTVELKGNRTGTRYVINDSNAFRNAVLDLTLGTKLGLNQEEVNLRGLSGAADTTIYNAQDTGLWDSTEMTSDNTHAAGVELATIYISGDANGSFAGTLGANVNMNVLAGAKQTLNGATVNGNISNAGELTLSGMGDMDFTKVTNTGTLNFGGGNTNLGTSAAGLGGTLQVLEGGQVTVTADLSGASLTQNAGTLVLSGNGAVDLAGLNNTGTLSIANTQAIGGTLSIANTQAIGGTVSVQGTGRLTLADTANLTGTLNFDLTGYTGGAIVHLGNADTSNITAVGISNYATVTTAGDYVLADGSADAISAISKHLGSSSAATLDHYYSLNTDGGTLNLNVADYASVTLGEVYTWGGSTDRFAHNGTYIVTKFVDGDITKAVELDDYYLRGWTSKTGTVDGTVHGLFSVGDGMAALRFAEGYGVDQKAVTLQFSPSAVSALIVEEGATGYSIAQDGQRTFQLGSTVEGVGASTSYINENFSIKTGNTALQGVQELRIAEGKTLDITNNTIIGYRDEQTHVYYGGTVTKTGAGTLSVSTGNVNEGGIFNQGEGTLQAGTLNVNAGGTVNLREGTLQAGTLNVNAGGTVNQSGGTLAASNALTVSGGEYNLTGGMVNAVNHTVHVNANGVFNMSAGSMTTSYLLLHSADNSSSTGDTFNLMGGVLNVTATGNGANAAAVVIGQKAGGIGTVTVTGGVMNVLPGRLMIGYGGAGHMGITGGEVNAQALDVRGNFTLGGDGRLNLGTGGVVRDGGTWNAITLNGGTLGTLNSANVNFTQAATLAVTGEGDTFTVDTQVRQTNVSGATTQTQNGGTITISGNLTGAGDIKKVGKGKLILSGTNEATGTLLIKEGELEIQGNGANGWTAAVVDSGATMTLAASCSRTNVQGITNNGTLRLGTTSILEAGQTIAGNGAVVVLGGGTLTSHNTLGLANASSITVSNNGVLDLSDGFVQSAGQHIANNGSLILGGTVALQGADALHINNTGVITLNEGITFNMDDAWWALMQPSDGSLTKTLTMFAGIGTVTGNAALGINDFYHNNKSLVGDDNIRSISMNNQGMLTITYWGTDNVDEYHTPPADPLTEIVLENNNPKTVKIDAGVTVVVDTLTSEYTENKGVISYTPGDYGLTKRGAGTLQVLSVGGAEIDSVTVTNGKIVFGAAPEAYTYTGTEAKGVHYTALAEGTEAQAGHPYYVYDEASGVYKPATDEQLTDGTQLFTRELVNRDIALRTGTDGTGTKATLDLGGSRLTSMGGSIENIAMDYGTHRITSVSPDTPAVLTDVELRLGNIINNDTSLVNVQFAGQSGLSGFVTIDQAGDNDLGANISVAAGATLTMGTASNSKLSFNFMRGTITDHGAIGNADVWDHHLIDLGEGANLVNWNNDHVAFYYEGVLTKGIISIGQAADGNDHLGVAHIDTTKAPELLWNGTGVAWNPTNTLSTNWNTGTSLGYGEGTILIHEWDMSEAGLSRFYALSNVHFNTLEDNRGLNSDIRLGQDLTVLNFTIGVRVDDARYGDSNWNGQRDPGEIYDMPTVYEHPEGQSHSVYNETAYTFSSGNLRVLRDLYVRTSADLTFSGTFNIEAQNVYLYNSSENAQVTVGGTLTAKNALTIGQTGVDSDCYGIYTFNGAVNVGNDLYIHVDSKGSDAVNVDQVLFNSTLAVGRDAMISGFGSKGFKARVDIGGNLTVSNCMYADPTQTVATSSQAAFSDILSVKGDLVLKNGGNAILFKRDSVITGAVQMYNGTLTLVDGTCNTFGNGGRNWTIQLLGDEGRLNLSPNTFAHIASLSSTDVAGGATIDHNFTIEGNSRNTDIYSMSHVGDLTINGGKITFRENTSGKSNAGGIHGDMYVGSTAAIFMNGNDIFSAALPGHEHGGHTITVDGGVVTLAAGTRQTMTDGSKLVLNSAIILAPVTNNQTKGTFIADGSMAVEFSGTTAFGASISVNPGADGNHANTLTFRDVTGGESALVRDGIINVGGAISAGENARIVVDTGTRVYLDGVNASMAGDVYINSTSADELHFLNSTLTVTQAGQIDHARIHVAEGASLDVIANQPVNVEQLVLEDHASIVLANLTGTKDPDPSLSCIKVTGTAGLKGKEFNLYFKDELRTMQTYALLSLTNPDLTEDQLLSGNDYQGLVNIYVHTWNEAEQRYEAHLLGNDQYELRVSDDGADSGRTLYLATFFGKIWDGGAKTGDDVVRADGWWTPDNTDNNWNGGNWAEGQTAIFRDIADTQSATVHVQGTIHVDGIYVTAEDTAYTFIGEGTTLRNLVDNDPDITKNGDAIFTMQDFGNEQLGKIDINRGVMQIKGSNIDFTEELVVAEGDALHPCELRIFSGSSLSERVYETDSQGGYVLDAGGHKILVADPVGRLSALGTGDGDYAGFTNLTADEGLLAGASPASPGLVSGAVVESYTVQDITFSGANKVVGTTFSSGVTNNGTLTLAGTTTFEHSITQGEGASLALEVNASVDIGALEYTKDVTHGAGDEERLHTYHLFTTGGAGAGITDPTGGASLFTGANVMINGAVLTKYNSNKLRVYAYDAANGTITLELNGVETPHWDPAWGIGQKKSPWLGHLILEGDGRVDNGNYMYFDNDAGSATSGKYRYNELLSEGTVSQVNPNATSIVVSFRIGDAEGKVFAAGNGKLHDNSNPMGEIWVYDTGSAFNTKVAGYVNGSTINFDNGGFADFSNWNRIQTNDLVTHMVLTDTNTDPDHRVHTAHAVGGSVYVNSMGMTSTYISVMDSRVTVDELIGGNVYGDLHGDTNVYVHKGHVGKLIGGSRNGGVENINITVDGGRVDSILGSSWSRYVNGDVHARLLGGQIGQFSTSDPTAPQNNFGSNVVVGGDIVVDYSSDVTGTTLLQGRVTDTAFANGKRATLNLINNLGVDELGGQRVFSLMGTRIEGFDIINIGENGLVEFNVLGNFMTASANNRKVTLEGTGRVILSNSDDRNGNNGTGKYWLTVTEGVTLQLNTSFIHSQSEPGSYPTFEIQGGATLDISGVPVKDGGGIGIRLVLNGHGVDGQGAMYKAGDVGMKSNLTALPFIDVKSNASIGGTESFCSDHNSYNYQGYVDMADGGLNHTLTKQGSSTWMLQRITVRGGTLNIVDTSTIQLTQNSSGSPWAKTPAGNDALGTRAASSSTDVVLAPNATLLVDNGAYKNNNGQTYQINTFSARSLSGNGTLVLDNSHMYLYTEAANTDFYAEYRDSKQRFWNSEGYTYAVFGGKITDMDATSANMLIKAGDGRQFLSGSESTYDGTTRMDNGILYLLGTSYGVMVKGSSTVTEGVLGTSHLEWNGGTVTLGNGVRIFNNGQSLSGAVAENGVSQMLIRVNGLTATVSAEGGKYSVEILNESMVHGGQTYYKLGDLQGVETVLCHGIYANGTRYYSGDVVDQQKGALYVLRDPYVQDAVNMSDLLVAGATKTVGGAVYTKVKTNDTKALSVAGVYEDGTAYTAGADLDTATHGDLYVNTSANATVTVTRPQPASVAVNSTYLMVQEDTITANDGTVYHKVLTDGIYNMAEDGIYEDGVKYVAGSAIDTRTHGDLYVGKAANSMVFVTLSAPRFDDATYSGVLSDAQPVNGVQNKGRLVKVGLGTLTIDQYNAYTGGTDVQAGTLNVQGWGLLGGTNSKDVDQTAGSSLMLSYDGSYGDDECFFINTDMNITGRGDVRWSEETGYTAALISNVGKDFNKNTGFTLAGTIAGDGNVLHMGEGTLYIDGWMAEDRNGVTVYIHDNTSTGNTYTGGTTVTNGRVFVRKDAGLGDTAQGGNANLVTLKGTEVRFEDCVVTLAAIQTAGREGYVGNSIQGKIVVGTENGTIRATGAVPDNGSMLQVTGDVAAKPTVLTIQGTGYWSEDTAINGDGTLVFQGGAATNCGTRFYNAGSVEGAGYLEGTGNLVLANDGKNGALAVAFSDIGTGTDGFTGNIYVQGKDAALFFDDGDFNATKSADGTGSITISGENVGIVARNSGIVVASGSKITLASNTDTWKQGTTTYTVGEGKDAVEIGPERAGGAAITAQYVTVVGGGTLEVIGGHADGYNVQTTTDLTKLRQATTLTVAEAAANGAGIATWGENEKVAYTNVGGAGLKEVSQPVVDEQGNPVINPETGLQETRIVQTSYSRVYEYDESLNRTSAGVVDTGDYSTGPLRLAANSNLALKNSSLNLSGSSLNLQRTATEKINLYLEFGQMLYNANGDPSQIVLFTDVNGLYISHENMLGTTPDVYANTGNDVYVFRANEYFQNCWQITDDTLLVYDTRAQVIYLDYAIPEPATGALAVLGLAALAARRRRKG